MSEYERELINRVYAEIRDDIRTCLQIRDDLDTLVLCIASIVEKAIREEKNRIMDYLDRYKREMIDRLKVLKNSEYIDYLSPKEVIEEIMKIIEEK